MTKLSKRRRFKYVVLQFCVTSNSQNKTLHLKCIAKNNEIFFADSHVVFVVSGLLDVMGSGSESDTSESGSELDRTVFATKRPDVNDVTPTTRGLLESKESKEPEDADDLAKEAERHKRRAAKQASGNKATFLRNESNESNASLASTSSEKRGAGPKRPPSSPMGKEGSDASSSGDKDEPAAKKNRRSSAGSSAGDVDEGHQRSKGLLDAYEAGGSQDTAVGPKDFGT